LYIPGWYVYFQDPRHVCRGYIYSVYCPVSGGRSELVLW